MRLIVIFSFLLLFRFPATAQNASVIQLNEKLRQHSQQDKIHVDLLNELIRNTTLQTFFRDSLIEESLQLSKKLNYLIGEAAALTIKAQYADKSKATDIAREALAVAEKSGDKTTLFYANRTLGGAMLYTSESKNALEVFEKALQIANETQNPALIIAAQLAHVDYYKNVKVIYPVALAWALKAMRTAERYHDTIDLPGIYRNIGLVYLMIDEDEKSLSYLQKGLDASRKTGNAETEQFILNDLGERYRIKGMYAEALHAYSEAALLIKDPFNIELNQSNVADTYQRMGKDSLCFVYAFMALQGAKQQNDTQGIAWIDNILSRAYLHNGKIDSAIYYGLQGYNYSYQTHSLEFKRDNSEALANAFTADKNFEKALQYYKIYIASKDSMLNNEVANKTNLAQYNYDLQKKQSEISVLNKDKELQRVLVQRQRFLLLAAVTILVIIITSLIILYRNNQKRKKANELLYQQNIEIQKQQKQLIQSEKMASLGELTAGIAHEIQNPLNFVNNFSEINKDLLMDLKEELKNGNTAEANELADDAIQNLEKISHHGKRAEVIIKGMLNHSRISNDKREATDLNALAEEYLRLSYHGILAKDASFEVTMKTNYDPSIGTVNIASQNIGKVILNLLNNAFYAVNQKKHLANHNSYRPTVTISTKKENNRIIICIEDNGTGIPQNIIDKIFQPFFTSKPAGKGAGLGLSLSYDIISKQNKGELRVESSEGEGSLFTIELPVS